MTKYLQTQKIKYKEIQITISLLSFPLPFLNSINNHPYTSANTESDSHHTQQPHNTNPSNKTKNKLGHTYYNYKIPASNIPHPYSHIILSHGPTCTPLDFYQYCALYGKYLIFVIVCCIGCR